VPVEELVVAKGSEDSLARSARKSASMSSSVDRLEMHSSSSSLRLKARQTS